MNYNKVYAQLIYKRKIVSPITKDINHCGERVNHHIIPRGCNGSNNSDNIVCLTVREHFIAHHLLYKIYGNTEFAGKMAYAFLLMAKATPNKDNLSIDQPIKITSRVYEKLCSDVAKENSRVHKNKKFSKEHCQRISNALKGKHLS